MRLVLAGLIVAAAACQPAPRHHVGIETQGAAVGAAAGGGQSGGARGAARDDDAGSPGADESDAGDAPWCASLAVCCATLDALDPARASCDETLARGAERDCATRLAFDFGWCE